MTKLGGEEWMTEMVWRGCDADHSVQILLTIMTGAFGLAGWHFSSNPTSSSSENKVARVDGSEPWKTGGEARYQYHPGGDPSKGKKDAPSALNEVIVPSTCRAVARRHLVAAKSMSRSFLYLLLTNFRCQPAKGTNRFSRDETT